MKKLISIMDKALSLFCISLSGFLVVCVVWQVFSRYVLNSPSTSTDEIARFLFIWVGLMGAAYTLGKKRHLSIDLLSMKLEQNPRKQAVLKVVIDLVCLFFALVILIYGGGTLMMKTLATGQVSPALGLEMGSVYAAIPLSGFFMFIYLIQDITANLAVISQPSKVFPTSKGDS
ncbi:TRAP transporter small permease [Enterovibrio sp. ZSDZ35]|uniref:TRAP transporter small permease protein n=1 Tax=Enterovibrio qingdaonensis TaxID=2899818 RepID=A0ABT5QI06_9GAMM|nr:TRAP transporter small permease [Enterovibrio sp. ZSDZ35]MDD1780607.1 TRAP transporter small permease [Enterovibrio sp. ZSDZ35]